VGTLSAWWDGDADGVVNMATDEVLGAAAERSGMPLIRFYGWSGATISLGAFQRLVDARAIPDIDAACQLGLNHPMGPLTLADFIGLDTCLEITRVLFEGTGDPKFRPAPLLIKYVEAGWYGRKSKRGFYDYTGAEPVPTR
jgi:3-hydroxyacyl-CoA dehydrogenase